MVYFIRQKGGGPIKIGHAIYPLLRLKQIQACSPVEVELIAAMHGSAKLERELHLRFSSSRLHGEWFDDSEELLSYTEEVGLPEDLGGLPDYKAEYKAVFPYRPK